VMRADSGMGAAIFPPIRMCTRIQGSKGSPSALVHVAYRSIGTSG
jgi:hypothetical protein